MVSICDIAFLLLTIVIGKFVYTFLLILSNIKIVTKSLIVFELKVAIMRLLKTVVQYVLLSSY